jgi:hypothetical protein
MRITLRFGSLDRRARIITTTLGGLVVGLCITLFATSHGATYIAAWTTSVVVALVALCMLSLPRRIILDDQMVELRCLVESTYIQLGSVVDVEVVGESGLRRKLPLLGVYGFGGYYGFWLDLATRKIYRTYITSRKECVVIHTSHRRYLVSCAAPEMLRSQILATKARCSKEE